MAKTIGTDEPLPVGVMARTTDGQYLLRCEHGDWIPADHRWVPVKGEPKLFQLIGYEHGRSLLGRKFRMPNLKTDYNPEPHQIVFYTQPENR